MSAPFSSRFKASEIRAAEGDFIETGLKIFESEDLTDTLLSIFMDLCVDAHVDRNQGWTSTVSIEDIGELYKQGLWLPCVPRVALAGQIDLRNDGDIRFGAIPVRGDGEFFFIAARQVSRPPHGWVGLPGSRKFYAVHGFYQGSPDRQDRRAFATDGQNVKSVNHAEGWMFSLVGDRLFPMKHGKWPNSGPAERCSRYGSAAIQTVSDFENLWIVETTERLLGDSHRTPLRLGVTAEIVSSLFYARQAPVAQSGRRRPILHWVRAHMRRLKDGVPVDISPYLRGITEFEMGGFPFRITQPFKFRR